MESPSSSFGEQVATLSRRLSKEDLTAVAPLYDLAGGRIVRFAEALTRNRADAEDVLQSVFMRVARNPRRIGLADSPWAYLMKIVRNEALQLINRRKRTETLPRVVIVSMPPSGRMEEVERHKLVRRAIRRLPPEQAEVIVLKMWEGLTFAEIAMVIDESSNTAASRYRYAMAKLSRVLRPVAEEVSHG